MAHPYADPPLLVIVAASAGGLEPIRSVARAFQPGPAAYLIAQHLAPSIHPPLLPDILRNTVPGLPISTAQDGERLRAGHVHVCPPGHDITLTAEGTLHVTQDSLRAPRPSLDALLRSAAKVMPERTVALLLSGTGQDGAQGALALAQAGGTVWVQTPASADFADMPRAAIAAGAAQALLSPVEMAARLPALLERLGQPEPALAATAETLDDREHAAFVQILALLQQETRIDFSDYATPTLLRQMGRSMQQEGVRSLAEYLQRLSGQRALVQTLVHHVLIGVTRFMRDKPAYTALTAAWRERLQNLPPDAPVRIWVCGCATGEELYSLAMLTEVLLEELGERRETTFFGSDVSASALAIARAASYDEAALAELPDGWRERFFERQGRAYKLKRSLRERCVFLRHDALRELPLLHIDLLSCRNLLIYLKPEARVRLLQRFHYALMPEGLLFLGRSEGLPKAVASGYVTLSGAQRIYRRVGETPPAWRPLLPPVQLPRLARRRPDPLDESQREQFVERLLARYVPPALLLERSQEQPRFFAGPVDEVLSFPKGEAAFALERLLPEPWRPALRIALQRASRTAQPVSLPLPPWAGHAPRRLYLEALNPAQDLWLLVFEPLFASEAGPAPAGEATLNAEALERENLLEAAERAYAELELLNQDLNNLSEQLQATNEELEASNEELNASNEELRTLNAELDRALAEAQQNEAELAAVLDALVGPLLVLDQELKLLRCNAQAATVWGLTDGARGQPFVFDRQRFPWPEPGQWSAVLEAARTAPQTVFCEGGGQHWQLNVSHWHAREAGGWVVKALDLSTLRRLQAERLELEQRLSALVTALQEAVFLAPATLEGFRFASNRLAEWLGQPGQAPAWADFLAAIDPEDAVRVRATWQTAPSQWQQRYRLKHAVGEVRVVLERGVRLPARDGTPACIAATLLDITEQARLEAAKAVSHAHLAALWRAPTVGMLLLDGQGLILQANDAAAAWLALTPETLAGQPFTRYTHAESRLGDGEQWAEAQRKGRSAIGQKQIMAADGQLHWVAQHLSFERHPAPVGEFAVVLWTLLDEVKAQEQLIFRQANFDPLTGLPNRTLLRDRLDLAIRRAVRHGEQVFVLFIDLDGFKEVNDLYGHEVGDQVLKSVAGHLHACVRESDTVARLGGDEFVILVDGAEDQHVAARIAEAVLARLHEPIPLPGRQQNAMLSASIGIAAFPGDASDPAVLLKAADTAMYAAKNGGKDRLHFFSRRLEEEASRRAHLKADLKQALDNGEFELFFQPVMTLPQHRCVGAEALLRWRRGETYVPPAEFIPIAEETGLIRRLGAWVLREAARRAEALQTTHPGARIAVNLSPAQLGGPELETALADITPALPHLIIELTESAFDLAHQSAAPLLKRLRRDGARIAIDDFGTGYSNLTRLLELEFDYIKIDQSLTARVGSGGPAEKLVAAIIDIAQANRAELIVEGVENETQLAFFAALAPIDIQGYHFARPLPWPALQDFLATGPRPRGS